MVGDAFRKRLPLIGHRAGVVAVDPEDRTGDLAPAGPDEPGERDDLAGFHLERDVDEESFAGEALDLENGRPCLGRFGLPFRKLASDHGAHEVLGGQPLQARAHHPAAVAQHGDRLTQDEDLLEAVGDEEHCGPLGAQALDDAEEPLDLDR